MIKRISLLMLLAAPALSPAKNVTLVVDDVPARHAELIAAGYEPLPVKEFKSGDELLARFFFILDPDGYKIELIQSKGRKD